MQQEQKSLVHIGDSFKKIIVVKDRIKLWRNDEGIVITMSQIARVKTIEQLKECGYKKDKTFFIIEEFLSVYYVYKNEQVYFSSISFLPSTACNLDCHVVKHLMHH